MQGPSAVGSHLPEYCIWANFAMQWKQKNSGLHIYGIASPRAENRKVGKKVKILLCNANKKKFCFVYIWYGFTYLNILVI